MSQAELPFTLSNRLITRERLVTALIFALLAHGVILLGVGFVSLVPKPSHNRAVEVTLVRDTRVMPRPQHYDYLAQANQRGPGNTRSRQAPDPALGAGQPFPQPAPPLAAAFQASAPALRQLLQSTARQPETGRQLLDSSNGPWSAASGNQSAAGGRPPLFTRLVPPSRAQAADSRSPVVTLPRLHGEHPRNNADTANTLAAVAAPYLEAWKARIEIVGRKHYDALVPAYIRKGRLTLEVTMNADGSIHGIRFLQRSRHPELDAAALKVIQLAAPFPPFPPKLRNRTERLTFPYTWTFIRGAGDTNSVGLSPGS